MGARIELTGSREGLLLLVASAFVLCGAIALVASVQTGPAWPLLLFVPPFFASFALIHWALNRYLPRRDPYLLPLCALVTGWGLLTIGRLAPTFLVRQTAWLAISATAAAGAIRLGRDLRWLRRFRYTWLLIGLALLATTLVIGVNPTGYGPRLWLGFWGVYFQPSELLKLLMVVFAASYLAEKRELLVSVGRTIGRIRVPPLAYVGPLLVMFGLAMVLLAWQQDLGAAMLFFFTFLTMLYVATADRRYVLLGLLLFALLGLVGYLLSARVELRVDAWLNPWPEATDRSYQIVQSLYAFGAGGVFGQGLGLGFPNYIPAVHTDFVFAAIAEDFGLLGAVAVIALYALLLWRGFAAAARAARPFESFLACGLTAGLVIQAWVIMSGNAKLTPIAGVTLPFISYGGSSLLVSFVTLALLLHVSARERDVTATSEIVRAAHAPMRSAAFVLGMALVLLGATCGYWGVARADYLAARGDNPRRVLYEERVVRGLIIDRAGSILAETEVASDGTAARLYPVVAAAPAVGYASLRYGAAGIEAAFDEELRGEAGRTAWEATWDAILHRPPVGDDVQLTLSSSLQIAAQDLLEGHSGAAVLLDLSDGDVLVLASSPSFEPATLDDDWDQLRDDPSAPLLNRAVRGLYQPGSALQTIMLAEALATGAASLDDPVTGGGQPVDVDGLSMGCVFTSSDPDTLGDAYRAACPAPFAALGETLGTNGLGRAVDRFLLTTPPTLEIPTEASEWGPAVVTDTASLRAETIGQGELTVSPFRMALVVAALGNDGEMVAPRLGLRVRHPDGNWQDLDRPDEGERILPPALARELLGAWGHYSDSVAGHLSQAMSGEGPEPHAWFLGVAPFTEPSFAVVVLIENAAEVGLAADIGVQLLEAAEASMQGS